MRRILPIIVVFLALTPVKLFSHERDFPVENVDQEIVSACHYFLNELIAPKYDGVLTITFQIKPKATLGLDRYIKLFWHSVAISTSAVELFGLKDGEDRAFNSAVECMVDRKEMRVLRIRFTKGLGVGDPTAHGNQTEIREFIHSDFESDTVSHKGKF